MLRGSVASQVPDVPATRADMVALMAEICGDPTPQNKQNLQDWPQPGVFRAPLQLAALVSPIVLLSCIRLDSTHFDKESLLNVSFSFTRLQDTDKLIIIIVRARA